MSRIRSPLKWAGGKSWLVEKVAREYSRFANYRYVDLFAGSCVIPLNINPGKALMNDLNQDLIRFWQWVQKLEELPELPGNSLQEYKSAIALFNQTRSPDLFFYLNRHCHGGLCRYNGKGDFNTPYYAYPKPLIPDLMLVKRQIIDWKFTSVSFEATQLNDQDFVFADPPYDGSFNAYTAQKFKWADQIRLAEFLSGLKCPIIATNAATERIVDLYKTLGFVVEEIYGPRSISRGDRQKAPEIFALKNLT